MKSPQKNNGLRLSINNIERKVALDIKRPIRTIEDLERFLAGWWCRHYNKPYKCTEITEYTFEELVYEYFDVLYRDNPEKLEKFLSREETEEEDNSDEEWLKTVMGEGYMSKKEQEKALEPVRDIIKAKDEEEEDISYKFDEFV